MLLGHDARAVRVGEQHGVERRQKPGGRGGVLPRPRRVGEVDELAARLVAEDDELLAQALDDRPEARQAGPRLHVGGGGGTERGEVVAHERLAGGLAGRRRRVETVLGQGERGRARERPAVLGGHHHERQPHPDRIAERAHVGVRELGGEPVAQLVERVRVLVQTRTRRGEDRVEVQRRAAGLQDRPQRGVQGRVDHGPLRPEGGRAHEVERRPLQRRPDDLALGQRAPEVLGREPLEPRPQRGEGRSRLLRLQPPEPVDGLGDVGDRCAREQQLARERRPPERAPRQDLVAHASRSSTAASAAASTASGGPAASITVIRPGSAAASAS